MSIHRASIMVALALALLVPRPARGADPPDETSAVALGEEGLRHFQAGRWQDALDLFRRANAIVRAPTLMLYTAHCHARLGDVATAYRLYRAVAREHLAEDAPNQFRTAQIIASQELHTLEPRLVPVKVAVSGPPEGQARLAVDGKEVPAAELGDLALLPGNHVVEASAPGRSPARKAITTALGHPAQVELALDPEPAAPPPAPPTPPAPPPPPPPAATSGLVLPATITLSGAGAALLVGTITGAVSLHLANDVKSHCTPDGRCPAPEQDRAATAGRLADASTAMFVVGTLAAAGGVTLAVLHVKKGAAVRVDATLGGAIIRGRF